MTANALRNAEATPDRGEVSRNLTGQRLGRKGQETRERIVAAAERLIADPDGPPILLTNIAREAGIRLTNLYLYFPDFEELLLVVLKRVMETAESAYLDMLRTRWPDEDLGQHCTTFLWAHYRFWRTHARLLHMRNRVADTDVRLLEYRQEATQPLLDLLVFQMASDGGDLAAPRMMATVVLTGFERVATVVTAPHFRQSVARSEGEDPDLVTSGLIDTEAHLLELAIRDRRATR